MSLQFKVVHEHFISVFWICMFTLISTVEFHVIICVTFRKLRDRDVSKFHIQLASSLLLMLLVFVAGIGQTHDIAGCVTVGMFLHYFLLVTWMWMAAEALLLFQKLVIVFIKVSVKYLVIVSFICWGEHTFKIEFCASGLL